MTDDIPIYPSALKRGYTKADIRHAMNNPLLFKTEQGDQELLIIVGPTPSGTIIEVGVRDADDDNNERRVVHASPVTKKHWPLRGDRRK